MQIYINEQVLEIHALDCRQLLALNANGLSFKGVEIADQAQARPDSPDLGLPVFKDAFVLAESSLISLKRRKMSKASAY